MTAAISIDCLVVDGTADSSSEDEMIGPSVELAAPADAQYNAAEEFAARYDSLQAEKQRLEVSGLSKSVAGAATRSLMK